MSWQNRGGHGGSSRGRGGHGHGNGPPVSRENIQVNQALGRSQRQSDLLGLIQTHLSMFNLVNASTALIRLAKTSSTSEQQQLKTNSLFLQLCETTATLITSDPRSCQPRHLSTSLWACATLDIHSSKLEFAILTVAKNLAHRFSSQELSNMIWAVAKLGGLGEAGVVLLTRLATAVKVCITQFTPQGLSNIMWALATLGHLPALSPVILSLGPAVVRSSSQVAGSLNPLELSTVVWGMAKLKITGSQHQKECLKLAQAVKHNLNNFLPRNFANVVWAVATLSQIEADPLLDQSQIQIWNFYQLFLPIISEKAREMNGHEISMVVWTMVTCAHEEPKVGFGIYQSLYIYNICIYDICLCVSLK